ncbi:MAG: hypothetical protein ACREV5_08160 [Steroidobacter sp.]
MNARAESIPPRVQQVVVARAEHISIEAEPEGYNAPARQPHRITRHTYTLASSLRGCVTELAILDGHFLGVHSVRPDSEARRYQFDLRYANPKPVRVRRVSWTWLIVAIGLALMGAGAAASAWRSDAASWLSVGAIGGTVALCTSVLAVLLFLRRTTESLEFRSAHGEVALVSVAGGIGSARGGKKFFVELIKNINAAKLARPQQKQQLLRDEMREHHRLKELGVLTEQQYEESKARILGAH